MSRISVFVLAFLLIAGVFATSIAIADENNSNNESGTSDVVPNTNVSGEVSDSMNELNESMHDGYKIVGSNVITYGQGWVISEGSNNTGYLFNALWVTQTLTNISSSNINSIRAQYANESKGKARDIRQALANAAGDSFAKVSAGRINIGVGGKSSTYKIVEDRNTSTNTSAVFNIYEANDKSNSNVLGTLTLSATGYSDMMLWTGKLVMNTGNFAGTYDVSIASKSGGVLGVTVTNRGGQEGRGIVNAVQNGNGNKVGLWQRFMGFFRGKNN